MPSFYYGQPATDAIARLNEMDAAIIDISGGPTTPPPPGPRSAALAATLGRLTAAASGTVPAMPDTVQPVDWSYQTTLDVAPTASWAGKRLDFTLAGDTVLFGPAADALPDNHAFELLLAQDALGGRSAWLAASSLLRVAGATPAARASYVPTRFVAPDGDDTNDGASRATPWATLTFALSQAAAGTVIEVADGTYAESVRMDDIHGTSGSPIVLYARNRWGAKVVPPAANARAVAIETHMDYLFIDGLQVDGSVDPSGTGAVKWRWGIQVFGTGAQVRHCHVHHIANTISPLVTSGGGILLTCEDDKFLQQAVGNLVHHIGVAGADPDAVYLGYSGIWTGTGNGVVANNIIHNVMSNGILNYHGGTHSEVSFNTVFACGGDGIRLGGGDIPSTPNYVATYPNANMEQMVVVNNICVHNAGYGLNEVASYIGSGNAYYNNLSWSNTAGATAAYASTFHGTVTADPGFTAYAADGSGDYTISAGGAAAGAGRASGTPAYATTLDFNGVTRAAPADIGAYALLTYTGDGMPDDQDSDDASLPTPTLYVDGANGSDTHTGASLLQAFKTIGKAASVAGPGDVVQVEPGVYRETVVQTNGDGLHTGTSSQPLVFQSRVKWGAKIVMPTNNVDSTGNSAGFEHRGDWVTINGFEIDGTDTSGTGQRWRSGIYLSGAHAHATRCHVHDIARWCTDAPGASAGGGAIETDTWYASHRTDALKDQVFGQAVTRCYVHHCGPASGFNSHYQGIYSDAINGYVCANVVHNISHHGAGIHMHHDARGNHVLNNTVFDNGFGVVVSAGDFVSPNIPPIGGNHVVANNVVTRNRLIGISEEGYMVPGSNAFHHNLSTANGNGTDAANYAHVNIASVTLPWVDPADGVTKTFPSGPGTYGTKVAGDPAFINYNPRGSGDYRLAIGSVCVGAGDAAQVDSALHNAVDFNGKAHPGAPSLGAYRFVPKAPPPKGVQLDLATGPGVVNRLACRWNAARGVFLCELMKGYV